MRRGIHFITFYRYKSDADEDSTDDFGDVIVVYDTDTLCVLNQKKWNFFGVYSTDRLG